MIKLTISYVKGLLVSLGCNFLEDRYYSSSIFVSIVESSNLPSSIEIVVK